MGRARCIVGNQRHVSGVIDHARLEVRQLLPQACLGWRGPGGRWGTEHCLIPHWLPCRGGDCLFAKVCSLRIGSMSWPIGEQGLRYEAPTTSQVRNRIMAYKYRWEFGFMVAQARNEDRTPIRQNVAA